MVRSFLAAGIAGVLALAPWLPGAASAQGAARPHCLEEQRDHALIGLVVVGGLGALLGDSVASGGGREGGAIIGGIGGALVGGAAGALTVNCGQNRYGYYDAQHRWIPNAATATGYFDPQGRWVNTPPPARAADYNPQDTRSREDLLGATINSSLADRSLDPRRGRRALRELARIRQLDAAYRLNNGELSPLQRQDIIDRLAGLAGDLVAANSVTP